MFENKKRVGQSPPPKNRPSGCHTNPLWQEIKDKLPGDAKALLTLSRVDFWTKRRTHLEAADLFQTDKFEREELQDSIDRLVHCAQAFPSIQPAIAAFLDERLQPRQYLRPSLEVLLNKISPRKWR